MGEHGGRTILHPPIGGRWCRIAHDLQARLECTYQSTVMHGQQAHRLLSCDPWLGLLYTGTAVSHAASQSFFIQPPCHRLKRTWAALVAEEQPPTCGQPSPKEAPLADAPTPAEHPILPPLPLPSSTWPGSSKKNGLLHGLLIMLICFAAMILFHPTDQPCRLAILHPLWPRSPETLPPTAAPPPADLLARGSSPHDQVASTLPAPLHQRDLVIEPPGPTLCSTVAGLATHAFGVCTSASLVRGRGRKTWQSRDAQHRLRIRPPVIPWHRVSS